MIARDWRACIAPAATAETRTAPGLGRGALPLSAAIFNGPAHNGNDRFGGKDVSRFHKSGSASFVFST